MLENVLTVRRAILCAMLVGMAVLVPALPQTLQADEAGEVKAATLLDKYVEVTGGKAAYEAIKSRVIKAQVSVPAIGMEGKMELYAAEPGKVRTIIETPGGNLERGSDGKVVWMTFPGQGPRILEGGERVTVLRDSTQDRFALWRKIFSKAEYVGEEDVSGKMCAKIEMTPKPIDPDVKESPVTVFIDLKSNLITKYASKVSTPEGELDVAVLLDDYKPVGKVKLAHSMAIMVQGIEQSVTIQSVELNKDIPAEKFALPNEVKELLEKKRP